MATKKPVKKTTNKKPTTKAKAQTARKATAKPRAQAKKPRAGKASTTTRRPDSNLPPSAGTINSITNEVLNLIADLDSYAANLRALDRQRHNGVGLKRQGFIEAAFRLSTKFPQYFPHWLDTEKFQNDLDLFNAIRSLVEVCRSLEEKAWNINVESSDMCQKAKGFLAGSLRIAQTPHIIRGVLSKAKLLSYPALAG